MADPNKPQGPGTSWDTASAVQHVLDRLESADVSSEEEGLFEHLWEAIDNHIRERLLNQQNAFGRLTYLMRVARTIALMLIELDPEAPQTRKSIRMSWRKRQRRILFIQAHPEDVAALKLSKKNPKRGLRPLLKQFGVEASRLIPSRLRIVVASTEEELDDAS